MAVKKSSSDKNQNKKKASAKKIEHNGNGQGMAVHSVAVSEYEVRQRAYELYQARGCQDGFDWDDWIRAEAEIRSRQKETA